MKNVSRLKKFILRIFRADKKTLLETIKNADLDDGYVDIPFEADLMCLARYDIKKKEFVHIEILTGSKSVFIKL